MRRTAAGVIGVYGWVAGCRAVGQRTATENGSVVGCSLAGGCSAPFPPLGARCPLSRLLARDGLCVE